MTSRVGPTFLIIGAARCGTTYLARQLGLHPEIGMTEPKEPHFLALAGRTPTFTGPGDDETINRRSVTDEAAWRGLFESHGARPHRGEGSVSTLYYTDAAIANIERHCPNVRMIVMLRDPTERAFSAHQYWSIRGYEKEPFSRGLDLEEERIRSGYHHIWHYTEMGYYSRQLAGFFEAFGRDRLLILDYEEFMKDRQAGISRCLSFLGASPWNSPEVDREVNASGQVRSRFVANALNRVQSIEPLRRALRRVLPFSLREQVRSANVRRQPLEFSDRARLDAVFADERRALASLLSDDAPAWATR